MMVSKRLVIVVLLAGMCCVSAGFCGNGEPADPFANTSVLVEAFVVRVSTEALAEMGISPIGQAPEGVTKIIEAMATPNGAEMVAATKVLVGHNQGSEANSENCVTVFLKSGEKVVDRRQYQNGVRLEVVPHLMTEKKVRLEYSFSASLFKESENEERLPITYKHDWRSCMTVQSGQPLVAGAAPSEGSVTFLILCATIQDAE